MTIYYSVYKSEMKFIFISWTESICLEHNVEEKGRKEKKASEERK